MNSRNQLIAKIVMTAICVGSVVLNKWFPDLFQLDAVSAAFLVIAILPWFSGVIKAVKLPFLEIELQEAKEAAERAIEIAQDAKGVAAGAQTRSRIAESVVVDFPGIAKTHNASTALSDLSEPQQLVDNYNEIRKNHKSGSLRTELMEQAMVRMIKVGENLQNFDLNARLYDDDRGWRLFAYAYVISHPDFSQFDIIAKSAFEFSGTGEDRNQPFGEYWSIRAMQAVAASRGEQVASENAKRILLNHYRQIFRGTDRFFEMKQLLEMLYIPIPQ